MGMRWKKRFPDFLGEEMEKKQILQNIENYLSNFVNNSVKSWASEESRSIETGKSFLQGLNMDPEGIVVDNSKAVYYKGEFGCTVTWCGRLNFSIALPPCAQVIGDFKESFDQTCAYDLLKFPNYYY